VHFPLGVSDALVFDATTTTGRACWMNSIGRRPFIWSFVF